MQVHSTNRPTMFLLAVACILAACSSLMTVEPKTFNEKLAAAYVTHTAVLDAATNALNASAITSADAENVMKLATESRKVLEGAKLAADSGDVATAEGRLALATTVLLELQTYLRERRQ